MPRPSLLVRLTHPLPPRQARGSSPRAFSLIELLVVVAIVAVLSTLAITAFNSTVRGTKVTSTAQAVSDALSLARSSAVARNKPVEIRFLELPKFDQAGSTPEYFRGMQIFLIESSTNSQALTKPFLFPNPIVASTDSKKSSILAQTKLSGGTNRVSGSIFNYIPLTFGSDGMIRAQSTGLTTTNEWFITVQTEKDLTTDATWPDNYATISVNPVTGNTKIYQPR